MNMLNQIDDKKWVILNGAGELIEYFDTQRRAIDHAHRLQKQTNAIVVIDAERLIIQLIGGHMTYYRAAS